MRSSWGSAVRRSTLLKPRRLLVASVLIGTLGLIAGTASAGASVTGVYGSLPPVGTASNGGTITFSQISGSTPTYIFPIVPEANSSVFDTQLFMNDMWLPVYNSPTGGTPSINLAVGLASSMPAFSDGDKTVTIQLKHGWKWSNGQPIVANDVVFDVDLLLAAVKESAANWYAFTPGQFPQSLASIKATGRYTIVMKLKKRFNPGYLLDDQLQGAVYALPSSAWNIASANGPHLNFNVPANAKRIYDYLSKQGGKVADFGSSPLWKIEDGPFKLQSFNPTNSSWTMVKNPDYGGSPKPSYSKLEGVTYTGLTPLINAIKTGAVDIATVDSSQLAQVSAIRSAGYSVFGYPALSFNAAFFNFKDTTGHFNSIISQLYIRQALADLEDQPAYLTGVFKNAGGLAYGPVPTVPPTPYTPADAVKTPYPYSPATAVKLLKNHGWKVVPGGQTTCAKPGAGAGECGAGIPKGTPFKFNWYYVPSSFQGYESLESESFASEAKAAAGIDITLGVKTFDYIISNFDDANPANKKYTNDWAVQYFGGFTDDPYPTTNSIFNTTGVYNLGAYSSAEANQLINNSLYGTNPDAVKLESSYLIKNVPALFTPNQDLLYAVSNKIGGPASSFLALTQYTTYPQYWHVNK